MPAHTRDGTSTIAGAPPVSRDTDPVVPYSRSVTRLESALHGREVHEVLGEALKETNPGSPGSQLG